MEGAKVLLIEPNVLARHTIIKELEMIRGLAVKVSDCSDLEVDREILNFSPDIILLSIADKHAGEFELLTHLRVRYPSIPLIVLSPRTYEGAEVAVTALRMGALDFITLPEQEVGLLFAKRHFKKRVAPKIRMAYAHKIRMLREGNGHEPHEKKSAFGSAVRQSGVMKIVRLIVMGGCTGSPRALFSIIPRLPASLKVPVVVTLHLPKSYSTVLARELDKISAIKVREVADDTLLHGGVVWIASGGFHSEVLRDGHMLKIRSHRGARENGERPSINILFRSAAQHCGPGALGVVLSGCGTDGLDGAQAINQKGGEVWVQNPRTAIASELPMHIIKSRISKKYYHPEELADQLLTRIEGHRKSPKVMGSESSKQPGKQDTGSSLFPYSDN